MGGAGGFARTSLAEEGELLVAVFGVPAVQPSLVHAFDLEALQLGAEDVVLAGRRFTQVGETLRWQEDLHGACAGGGRDRKQSHDSRSRGKEERSLFLATDLCKPLPSGPPASGSGS